MSDKPRVYCSYLDDTSDNKKIVSGYFFLVSKNDNYVCLETLTGGIINFNWSRILKLKENI